MEQLDLPIIITGEKRRTSSSGYYTIKYESGLTVRLPKPSEEDVEKILTSSNEELRRLPLDDILAFLNEVSKRWNDPNYELRKQGLKYAVQATGYNERVVSYDFFVVSAGLTRSKMYDFIASDLGDPYFLDEWRPVQACMRHAVPRGRVLHLMVGNVPMASMFTIARSVATKNQTIAKLPKRDVITSLFFALTCLDVDPDHPISKSLSVLYWEPDSTIGDRLIRSSDVVCVWGQQDAVDSVKRKIHYRQEFLEFGPRRSVQLIGRDTPDWDYAAMKSAYDLSVYDQEACFSPQVCFVEKPARAFIDRLPKWLDYYTTVLPRGVFSVDAQAHVTQKRLEAEVDGNQVIEGAGGQWTLIVQNKVEQIPEHPLNRTLYIFPVDDLSQATDWIRETDAQTLAVHPFSRANSLRDELCESGIERIVDLGRAGRPRPGFTHDGVLPLSHMVRWVSEERPLSFKYKFVTDDPGVDDAEIYGWSGEEKEPRPYKFKAKDTNYGFRVPKKND